MLHVDAAAAGGFGAAPAGCAIRKTGAIVAVNSPHRTYETSSHELRALRPLGAVGKLALLALVHHARALLFARPPQYRRDSHESSS